VLEVGIQALFWVEFRAGGFKFQVQQG
jgi:hypothetical protein